MAEPFGSSFHTILIDINRAVMRWQLLEALQGQSIAETVDVAIVSSTDKKDREKAFKYPMVTTYFPEPFYNIEEKKKLKQGRLVEN